MFFFSFDYLVFRSDKKCVLFLLILPARLVYFRHFLAVESKGEIMKHVCEKCGSKMKKNGFTKKGKQRYRCSKCNASKTYSRDTKVKWFKLFLEWLFSKKTEEEFGCSGRTFRRHTLFFWTYWPRPIITGEIYRVIFIDGIHLGRICTILIAKSETHVLHWLFAKRENAEAYKKLLSPLPKPEMVVTDGSKGSLKALKEKWREVPVQRCLFHVMAQVRRNTTQRPKMKCAQEILELSKDLTYITTRKEKDMWINAFYKWKDTWQEFLREKTEIDGKLVTKHKKLVSTKNALSRLIESETLFTYLEMQEIYGGIWPKYNNHIESFNAKLKDILRNHKGLKLERRIKAIYWACYHASEAPQDPKEIIEIMEGRR